MIKNFDKWNEIKKGIDSISEGRFYKPREIWWIKFGINVGFEQNGGENNYERTGLVLKFFSRHICLVLPITTSKKENKYHFPIGNITGKESFVILSQVRLIDTRRFINRVAILDQKTFEEIKNSFRDLI